MILPWQQVIWQQITDQISKGRLHHAQLFYGRPGTGKLQLSQLLAQRLLCQSPQQNSLPCGQCQPCQQYSAGTHPDFIHVEPEESGKAIKIDQIRELASSLNIATHYSGGYRVVLIHPAEQMNLAAYNALLKTLEEPHANNVLILTANATDRMPATILSRCQKHHLPVPKRQEALNWLINEQSVNENQAQLFLDVSHNQPLVAANYSDEQLDKRKLIFSLLQDLAVQNKSPVAASSALLKIEFVLTIQWVYSWISDLIRLKLSENSPLTNRDYVDRLTEQAQKVELGKLFRYIDDLTQSLKQLAAPLNHQLQLEALMLSWQEITSATMRDK